MPRRHRFLVNCLPTIVAATLWHYSISVASAAVPVASGAATLGGSNTKVQFLCAHVGPKPDPRTGKFTKLTVKAYGGHCCGSRIRHAQFGSLIAAGLTGTSLAILMGPKDSGFALQRISPLFGVLVGGISLLACVEPDPPQPWLLITPLLTWALWLPLAVPPIPSGRDGTG